MFRCHNDGSYDCLQLFARATGVGSASSAAEPCHRALPPTESLSGSGVWGSDWPKKNTSTMMEKLPGCCIRRLFASDVAFTARPPCFQIKIKGLFHPSSPSLVERGKSKLIVSRFLVRVDDHTALDRPFGRFDSTAAPPPARTIIGDGIMARRRSA
jgi:hypothetical protein